MQTSSIRLVLNYKSYLQHPYLKMAKYLEVLKRVVICWDDEKEER
jgi:hypothetical protein